MKRCSIFGKLYIFLLVVVAVLSYSTITQAEEIDGIVYTGTDSIVITDYKGTATSLDLSEYFPDATEITIKAWAFANTTLTSIVMPETVVSIGESAFDSSSIQTITFSPDTQSLVFGKSVFEKCSNLASLNIPDCVTAIPERFCYGCSSLLSVSLPDSCSSIGNSAFYNCSSLTSVSLPASCSFVGDSAFLRCKQLQSVTFEENENNDRSLTLAAKAFNNCDALTSITIPEGCTNIPSDAFWSCDNLSSITIPESCTSISGNAFAYCKALSQINSSNAQEAILPQNCTSIGATAFQDCTSLKNVEIPEICTSIGNEAFAGCTGLNKVVFLNANTSIGENAFPTTQKAPNIMIYCTNIGSVTIYAENASLTCESSVQSISVTELPDVREYMYSENGDLDMTGLKVKASVMSLSAETGYENKEVDLKDCIISSFDSAQAGKQTITITYGGKQTSFDVKVYYDIENTTVTVQPAMYTGSAVVPSFVVYGNDTEQALVYETDFLYTCQNNIKVGDEATLTLIGIGAYKGEKAVTFSIVSNENSDEKDDNEDSDDTDGKEPSVDSGTKSPSTDTSKPEVPQKGKTYTYKNMFYKVTGSNTVTFMKPVNKKVQKITIPAKVKILGKTFKVTKINKKACYAYKKLTTVTIGNNVATIGDQAFAKCTKLKKVIIGKGVKTIGKQTFAADKSLRTVKIRSKKLKTIKKGAFKGVNKNKLFVTAPTKKTQIKYEKLLKKQSIWK